jgi:hypothetical protein
MEGNMENAEASAARIQQLESDAEASAARIQQLEARLKPITDIELETERLNADIDALRVSYADKKAIRPVDAAGCRPSANEVLIEATSGSP